MINVIATITLNPGVRQQFLAVFNANIPAVLEEDGCIEYFPAIDVDAGIEIQVRNPDTVVVIEKWSSVEALHAHLVAPHMQTYKEQVKDLVASLSLKVLENAN
ncbi:MAG: quinol monooxygenase YgiN [Mariniblastus sp.]|jgi:quinol monooxygenase YgiN